MHLPSRAVTPYRAVTAIWIVSIVSMPLVVWGVEPGAARIDFTRDIRPLLSRYCFQCHGPDAAERKGGTDGLRLDTKDGALQDLGGYAAVVPGKPDESALLLRIRATDPEEQMPPPSKGKQLAPREIELLEGWVRQGAPFTEHWAYERLARPDVPSPRDTSWPRNNIDRFVLARLEVEKLQPAPEADRYTLARRLALNLTGVPPSLEDVDRFVNDGAPDAYERYVDRLLDMETYGEHWARLWLDLARYADSAGYADDPPRTIWAYRDYVIRSFNNNKPFDQFTIEQLAGDLLPDPSIDQLIATAFHRNTLTNNEGGTSDEEFRNVAIVDRVNTTFAVWMGTTIHCAQCHNHKYDPISQSEFFQAFATFNGTGDADRADESPLVELWSPEQLEQRGPLLARIAESERAINALAPDQGDALADEKGRLTRLQESLAEIKPATTVPVLRELPANERRTTRIQFRGNFNDLGDEVEPGVPTALHGRSSDAPVDRLELAKWIMDGDHPLTARVIANRYWEQFFGVGIVRTSEDFGSQGELPSDPALLDWLAAELVDRHWDLKQFVRTIVTSATYRQSSRVTQEMFERDPDNRLCGRGPRFRLSAEMIRDQALFVSGLLSVKMYGPPVKPSQPALGISAAFGGGIDWQTSDGEDKYRRAIYTTWRRSNPYPSMATFDAPTREVCTSRRDRTNTPLQALVTLNDPVYIEAAQALARRIVSHSGDTRERVAHGFRLCLSRPPSDEEITKLAQLHDAAHEKLAAAPEDALKLATIPLGPIPDGGDPVELAAWTVVGNVLMNLDESLMNP